MISYDICPLSDLLHFVWSSLGPSRLLQMAVFNSFLLLFLLLYNVVLVLPYINMHLSQVYTCSPSWTPLPPPAPYHPSGSSQCTSPKHPVSCIEPGLATHFIHGILHVSMPFSQIFPPSPSPTESIKLFYTSVSLLLSRGMVWGGRREEGSGWGTHVYLWWIHFDIWQN